MEAEDPFAAGQEDDRDQASGEESDEEDEELQDANHDSALYDESDSEKPRS